TYRAATLHVMSHRKTAENALLSHSVIEVADEMAIRIVTSGSRAPKALACHIRVTQRAPPSPATINASPEPTPCSTLRVHNHFVKSESGGRSFASTMRKRRAMEYTTS